MKQDSIDYIDDLRVAAWWVVIAYTVVFLFWWLLS